MRIIFFGTSEFAVKPLEAIIKSRHEIACVVTQPQKQMGRGLKLLPQPLENDAASHNLRILKFDDVNSKEAAAVLKRENAEIFVVVSFGQILSKELLSIPSLYSINIHGSLLPKYRGAAPIQWAIINGEKGTGVSIIRMDESLDKGDIIAEEAIDIDEDDDSSSLSQKLSSAGAVLIVNTLDIIESGQAVFTRQDQSKASYAPKLKKEDGLIDWKKSALTIRNLVRGCYPWPSAYTYLNGKILKILKADVAAAIEGTEPGRPACQSRTGVGRVVDVCNEGILVACGKNAILIKRLQLEGKTSLDAAEFLRGNPIKKDTLFKK